MANAWKTFRKSGEFVVNDVKSKCAPSWVCFLKAERTEASLCWARTQESRPHTLCSVFEGHRHSAAMQEEELLERRTAAASEGRRRRPLAHRNSVHAEERLWLEKISQISCAAEVLHDEDKMATLRRFILNRRRLCSSPIRQHNNLRYFVFSYHRLRPFLWLVVNLSQVSDNSRENSLVTCEMKTDIANWRKKSNY